MPRVPKPAKNGITEITDSCDDPPTEDEPRSYYYDDAYGYEDFVPDEDIERDDDNDDQSV